MSKVNLPVLTSFWYDNIKAVAATSNPKMIRTKMKYCKRNKKKRVNKKYILCMYILIIYFAKVSIP